MDIEALRPWNPHWEGAPVSRLILKHDTPRAAVERWVEEIQDPVDEQWMLRPGPRQVGKTTSLGHVARRLLESVHPRQVVIAPLDDPGIREYGSLEALIAAAARSHAPSLDRPLFILLDEIQELPDWARSLKAAWDRHHPEVRVLATGSSALRLLRPADADFHGRIRTVTMHTMKFREVVEAHPERSQRVADWEGLRHRALACRQAMTSGHESLSAPLEDLHGWIVAHGLGPWLQQVWLEYLAWGGYPATRPGRDLAPAMRLERYEAALNTVLARDVVHRGVRKLRDFQQLFRHICRHPGGKFEPYKLSRRLDADGATIAEWKLILEDAMLVQQLPPLKPNLAPDRGRDKAYPTDPGWTSFFRSNAGTQPHEDILGLAAETALVDHVRRLQYNVTGTTALTIGFVTRPEVDVAADLGRRWLLLEAKYQSDPRAHLQQTGGPDDLRVVATRDQFLCNDAPGAHFVPAHEFALIV